MAKESSFDIVSKVNLPDVQNAIGNAMKEVANRYDFKGSKSDITLEKDELVLISDNEFKMDQLKDVLVNKLIKQNVATKNIQYTKSEKAAGGTVRQRGKLIQGIDSEQAKKINTLIKNSGIKVKSQIQGDQVRVTGKNKDDLQQIISLIRGADLSIDIQFINYR